MELWNYDKLIPALVLIVICYVVAIIYYIVLIIEAKKLFFIAFFSLLCIFFYFTPWMISPINIDWSTPWVISIFWFLIAWIFVIIRLIKITVNKPQEKNEVLSFIVVGLCYLVLIISCMNKIIITV